MVRLLLADEGWMVTRKKPARRVELITVRRLWWSAACVRYAACARI